MRAFTLLLMFIATTLLYSQPAISEPECLVPLHDPSKPCNLELDGDRLIANLSSEEIQQSKSELVDVTKAGVPASMQGGLVFDAYLIRRNNDKVPGQVAWTLRETRIYAGQARAFKHDQIQVISPAIQAGGAEFIRGRKYRVFAVELHGRPYVWDATVLQLNKSNARP